VDTKIPAGVEDGTRIRFNGGGEAAPGGGPAGDLYVVLHVKDHPFFVREGNDLHCAVPISVTQAAVGAEIQVPTLEGEHELKIPDGTQPGTTFRIRNKGVPVLNGHGKGDLYVEVHVQIPTKLSKRQKEVAAGTSEGDVRLGTGSSPGRSRLVCSVRRIKFATQLTHDPPPLPRR
jgi:molecular chaperone DnaJ